LSTDAIIENDETIVATAEAHYRSRRFSKAMHLLKPLATNDSPSPSALRVYGLCRLRPGAVEEAVDLLEHAYRLAPTDAWVQLHYGIGLQAAARYDEAAELFRASQKLLPADPAPSLNLASALLGIGDTKAAIKAARKATLRGGKIAQTHYTLGLAYLAAGYAGRAVDGFRMATRLAPQFADAWLNLGVAYYRAGDIDRAKGAWSDTRALASSDDIGAHQATAPAGSACDDRGPRRNSLCPSASAALAEDTFES
jgi:Flp pilus assembly protein TadD